MAPSNTKVNFKTYEAQYRLMRAIVAAHPEVKWNYKEIAACFGSDMTEHALNHRFRRLRAHAAIIREGRDQGLYMKSLAPIDDLPMTKDSVDVNNIAKYFGQSTPDGIQFQFRSIKRDAETLRESDGSSFPTASPATTTTTTTTTSTTGGGNGSSSLKTPSRRGLRAGAAVAASSGRKRARPAIKRSSEEDDDQDDDDDQEHEHDAHDDDRLWSDDYTPSKRGKYAPSAAAAARPTAANGKELSDSPASSVAPRVDDSYDGYGDGEI